MLPVNIIQAVSTFAMYVIYKRDFSETVTIFDVTSNVLFGENKRTTNKVFK